MPRDDEAVPIRREVLHARGQRHMSAIVLPCPQLAKRAAWAAAATLATLGLVLGCCEHTRKVHVSGTVEPSAGAIRVVAPQFGRIVAQHVRNGDAVNAGQVMFEVSGERSVDERITASLATRRRELRQRLDLHRAQLTERGAALAAQQHMVEADIATHSGSIAIQNDQIRSARANLQRYEKLRRQGFVAPAQVEQIKNNLNAEQVKRDAMTMNLSAATRNLAQLRQDAAANARQLELAGSESRQALAELEQQVAEHDGRLTMRVTAPAKGTTTAIAYKPGQSVPAGAPLATVLPSGSSMEAVLLVPSRVLAQIEPGQQVWLRIDAFPYQKYGLQAGTVAQVDRSPATDVAPGTDPRYRVTVALAAQSVQMDGKARPVEAGMQLEAAVLQDRRKLFAWLFEPLIGAAKGRAL
ncbi:MAG: HlyD family efflux transporter periplasmic adaptor subunit [Pseudomonadota bacterium]